MGPVLEPVLAGLAGVIVGILLSASSMLLYPIKKLIDAKQEKYLAKAARLQSQALLIQRLALPTITRVRNAEAPPPRDESGEAAQG